MHTSLAPQPDLDTPPWMLLLVAAICFAVWALLWLHDRRAAVAEHRRIIVAHMGSTAARAEDDDAARVGRGLHSDHGGDQRDRPGDQPLSAGSRLKLDDGEVVALARYFALGKPSVAAGSAIAKIERAAMDIINADRAGRR